MKMTFLVISCNL